MLAALAAVFGATSSASHRGWRPLGLPMSEAERVERHNARLMMAPSRLAKAEAKRAMRRAKRLAK